MASVKSDLTVDISGVLSNVSGTLASAGRTALTAGSFDNTGGSANGNRLHIDTGGASLSNAGGTLASVTDLAIVSGALVNDSGLIRSGGAMSIDTHGQTLSNRQAAGYPSVTTHGGISSGGTLSMTTGAVDNTAGYIGSTDALTASSDAFRNGSGGIVFGKSTVSIDTHGASYDNTGGKTQAVGDLTIKGASVINRQGLIRSTGTTTLTTTLTTGVIDNASTLGSNQGIEGDNVVLNAGTLNNTGGAIRANADTTIISSGSVDNTNGLISAGSTLRIADRSASNPVGKTLSVINTGGTLLADQSVQLDAAGYSGNGTLTSKKDISVLLTRDVTNNAVVQANGSLSYGTTGNLTNNGQLLAGNNLAVSAATVTNTASAEMTGTNGTAIAAGTLTNRGLIDSNGMTRIDAGTVNNLGTGRIYGDVVAIGAGVLNNDMETVNGQTASGTIAARNSLDLGVGTLNNREHALIYSAGDLFIGGALDSNGFVIGKAGTLNNASATIESSGDMTLTAGQIWNTDAHMRVTRVNGPLLSGAYTVTPLGGIEQPIGQFALDRVNRVWATIVNGQFLSGKGWVETQHTQEIDRDVAVNPPDPARIVAGGNMTINGMLHNRDSQVIAGGQLSIAPGNVDNTPTQGYEITTDGGVTAYVPPTKGSLVRAGVLAPIITTHTFDVGASQIVQYSNAATLTAPGAARIVQGNVQASAAGGVAGGLPAGVILEVPSTVSSTRGATGSASAASGSTAASASAATAGTVATNGAGGATGASGTSSTGAAASAPFVVRTSTPTLTLPTASLFHALPGAASHYLIETDPRFANYRTWLSSDYLLAQFGLDPNNTLKRLDDGFYEQMLIRQQMAQLTGYRYVEGFSNDQDEYTALMSAGVTFAKQFNQSVGVALTRCDGCDEPRHASARFSAGDPRLPCARPSMNDIGHLSPLQQNHDSVSAELEARVATKVQRSISISFPRRCGWQTTMASAGFVTHRQLPCGSGLHRRPAQRAEAQAVQGTATLAQLSLG